MNPKSKIWITIHARMLSKYGDKLEDLIDTTYEAGEDVYNILKELSLLELLRIKYGKE